jgi:hypothetical protein
MQELRFPAGQGSRLPDPTRQELLIELVVLVNVEVACVLVLGLDGWNRTQRRTAKECYLDVFREAMKTKEKTLVFDAIEGSVPLHSLVDVRHVAHDERVEIAPDAAFPARHSLDVGLHGGVAVALRDLRIAACEEFQLLSHLCGWLGRFLCHILSFSFFWFSSNRKLIIFLLRKSSRLSRLSPLPALRIPSICPTPMD